MGPALATLGVGCYWHGWPVDDKVMCGHAYPVERAECERSRRADAPAADASPPDAGLDAGR